MFLLFSLRCQKIKVFQFGWFQILCGLNGTWYRYNGLDQIHLSFDDGLD